MSTRDELAYELAKLDNEGWVFEPARMDGVTREGHGPEMWLRRADAILAAGYRKPPVIDNDKLVVDGYGQLLLEVEEDQ